MALTQQLPTIEYCVKMFLEHVFSSPCLPNRQEGLISQQKFGLSDNKPMCQETQRRNDCNKHLIGLLGDSLVTIKVLLEGIHVSLQREAHSWKDVTNVG